MITIELLFAANNHLWHRYLTLSKDTTVQSAIEQSGIYVDHPEAEKLAYGIFGELCSPDTPLQSGDRIEIYRPLIFDPMESRRRRAAHRQDKKQSEQG